MLRRTHACALGLAISSAACSSRDAEAIERPPAEVPPALAGRAEAWAERGEGGIRGITVGPIENSRHPGVGYGSPAYERTLDEAVRLGATWVSLTPFGRIRDLAPTGIDLTFESPFEENRKNMLAAMREAHARGLRVFLVPHVWVETGAWRGFIDPGSDAAWKRWMDAYRAFVLTWADVAREGRAEMMSVGVELGTWVTTPRASGMLSIIADIRRVYPGLLTYSANWDDAQNTLLWSALDLIGINAFYPLSERKGATPDDLAAGGRRVAASIETFARTMDRPVVLTEIGYTTRPDAAVDPWEWPDAMKGVRADQRAQADAYRALLAPFLRARWCAGFFVWRYYADPDDVSQEAEWGFSPRAKLAELVLRDAFTARWAVDGPRLLGETLGRQRARHPGFVGWERSAW